MFYALFFTTQCLRIEKQLKSMFLLLICDNSETTSDHFFQSFSMISSFRLFHHEQECSKIENCVQPSNTLFDFRGVSRPSDPTFCTPVIIYIFQGYFYQVDVGQVDVGQGWVNM